MWRLNLCRQFEQAICSSLSLGESSWRCFLKGTKIDESWNTLQCSRICNFVKKLLLVKTDISRSVGNHYHQHYTIAFSIMSTVSQLHSKHRTMVAPVIPLSMILVQWTNSITVDSLPDANLHSVLVETWVVKHANSCMFPICKGKLGHNIISLLFNVYL
jgi:hypothetical protein